MQQAPILVVGASSGIGRRVVEGLLADGKEVVTAGRSNEVPVGVMKHLNVDVTTDGIEPSELPEMLGGLVYCPGSIDLKPMRSIRSDDLEAAFRLNVLGAFRVVQVCLERLKRAPIPPSIVMFSTVAVQRGMPFHVGVSAVKGAVEGMVRAMSAEFAPVIRVNCIAPGLVSTPLSQKLLNSPEKQKASADRHPMKRVGEPEDVAAMARFLLSSQASWITGQVIGVDGGMSAI